MFIYSNFANNPLLYLSKLAKSVDYCFYLTGSSGNGKNYLMRKIGDYFSNSTYIFCSFDPQSLDGVLIKNKVLIFDGAYPHNLLPNLYKIDGEVVNMGESLKNIDNSCNFVKLYSKEKIAKNEYSKYGKIYNSLLDANYDYYSILSEESINNNLQNFNDIPYKAMINNKIKDVYYKKPKIKKYNYSVNCSDKFYAKYILSLVCKQLNENKINHIAYHNLYNNKFIEGIELEDMYIGNNLAFGENINIYGQNNGNFINYELVEHKINKLQKEAIYFHKKLEREYKPYISFEKNDDIYNKVVTKIKAIL